MTIGGAAVFELNIAIPQQTASKYIIEIFAPVNDSLAGKQTICDIRTSRAGWNIPCLNDTILSRQYLSVDGNKTYNYAKLEMGYIANVAVDGATSDKDVVGILFLIVWGSDPKSKEITASFHCIPFP